MIIQKYLYMKISRITIRVFFISLIIIAFSKFQILASNPEFSGIDVNHRELKILTWNIYMLPFCAKYHRNSKRAEGIAREITQYNYDIIVFEEAFDYRARKILRSQLKGDFPFIYGPANESLFSFRINSGLWILSKVPLHQLEQIEFRNRFGVDAFARKGAVLFEGEWQGQPFQLLGTHLQNDSPDTIRHGQCHEISDKLLNKYARADVPQIVCGDFNIEFEDKDNYRDMLRILDAENGGLQGDLQSSFDEVDNKLAQKINGKRQLIDYVLVRNNKIIKAIDRKVAAIKNRVHDVFSDLSDHYGIEAVIRFENHTGDALTLLH